jgi:hypothetical protein
MSDVSKARLAPDAAESRRPSEAERPAGGIAEDRRTPGDQERPLTEEERLDEAVDETFPASDPIAPSRIDGPGN